MTWKIFLKRGYYGNIFNFFRKWVDVNVYYYLIVLIEYLVIVLLIIFFYDVKIVIMVLIYLIIYLNFMK
jgi:hypothetical protein